MLMYMITCTLINLLITVTFSNQFADYIFCPQSYKDDNKYQGVDFGLNIFARVETEEGPQLDLKPDCYLRYSNRYRPTTITNDFIDPKANTVVFSHGWQSGMYMKKDANHSTPDQWSKIVPGKCNGEKVNPPHPDKKYEECPPDDHDAQYWIKHGWNVIMIDWKQFAGEPWVEFAERKIYDPVYDGKTVAELIYDKLTAVLDITGWDGDELRFAGASLGSQLVVSLGGKWRTESRYRYKLKRIALLDHFYTYKRAEYAVKFILPQLITPADGDPVVIENYKTSWLSKIPVVARQNVELNVRTVLVYLKPRYYSISRMEGPHELVGRLTQKHNVAFAGYMHCMKWYDLMDKYPKRNDYPSCRMTTEKLRDLCDLKNKDYCDTFFEQTEEDEFDNLSVFTTWDFDDAFKEEAMIYEYLPPFTEYIRPFAEYAPGITADLMMLAGAGV